VRRLFVLALLVLVAAASVAWLVRLDSGYVLLQFHGTRVETTAWVALAGLVLLLLGFYYVGRALVVGADLLQRLLGHAPRTARRTRGDRGMQAFFEGRWSEAARLLSRGARSAGAPLANYLLAARAAAALGDTELARGFLELAGELPGSTTAVRIERAWLLAAQGEHAAAVRVLDEFGETLPPGAIAQLLVSLPASGDWARLGRLLPEARRLQAAPAEELDVLEERCFAALLDTTGKSPEALKRALETLPSRLRRRPALAATQARALAAAGRADEALGVIEAALAEDWTPALVRLLGSVTGRDPGRALARAEALLARHRDDAELLLALGRLALANRLWGKARDYLEASLAHENRMETLAELARLSESLGETARAAQLRERALALVTTDAPALPPPTAARG
jgi:HemY protein